MGVIPLTVTRPACRLPPPNALSHCLLHSVAHPGPGQGRGAGEHTRTQLPEAHRSNSRSEMLEAGSAHAAAPAYYPQHAGMPAEGF